MILDQITLAGPQAYLRGDGAGIDAVNLVDLPAADVEGVVGRVRRARSLAIGEGMLVKVSAVHLYLERADLLGLGARTAAPWLTVRVDKEMYPGLFKDPYARRTHRIAGFEDFSRGRAKNLRVMEVENVATLVSTGAEAQCSWRSAIYTMPDKLPIDAVAWDIPTHKDTPADSFTYELDLRTWTGAVPTGAPVVTRLATGANPRSPRFWDGAPPLGASHYQVELRAVVRHDAPLRERHVGEVTNESLGRPLLTGIYLLETVPTAYAFHSLAELLGRAAGYELFGGQGGDSGRLLVTLDVGAALARGESIVIDLHGDPPGLQRLEARLEADVLVRPPRTEVG